MSSKKGGINSKKRQGTGWAQHNASPPSRERLSPMRTVASAADLLVDPIIPKTTSLNRSLASRLDLRCDAALTALELSTVQRLAEGFEELLITTVQRTVLATFELGVTDADRQYSRFKEWVLELDYKRSEPGFTKLGDGPTYVFLHPKDIAKFISGLSLPPVPPLPKEIPQSLTEKAGALVCHLKTAARDGYTDGIVDYLVREMFRVSRTAQEVNMKNADSLVQTLDEFIPRVGYTPTTIGYMRIPEIDYSQ